MDVNQTNETQLSDHIPGIGAAFDTDALLTVPGPRSVSVS